MRGFVVVDLETTGLSSKDRIVELGLVRLDPDGKVVDNWETLVNPRRHIGASGIHGISARDVVGAPAFSDIADFIGSELNESVFVGHNASFDARFLARELSAAGALGAESIPYLDTLQLSKAYLDLPTRKLGDICEALGIINQLAHSALSDAMATAELLRYLLDRTPSRSHYSFSKAVTDTDSFCGYRFSDPVSRPVLFSRTDAKKAYDSLANGSWVTKAVAKRDVPDSDEVASYFKMLDDVFLDRRMSFQEQERILTYAAAHELSSKALQLMHANYLDSLLQAVYEDGVLTENERSTVSAIAKYLGLSISDEKIAEYASQTIPVTVACHALDECIDLFVGDRVCVTGPILHSREYWDGFFEAKGVKNAGIAKATTVLIAGDPDSSSGKTKKARQYGIPVIAESAVESILRFS